MVIMVMYSVVVLHQHFFFSQKFLQIKLPILGICNNFRCAAVLRFNPHKKNSINYFSYNFNSCIFFGTHIKMVVLRFYEIW